MIFKQLPTMVGDLNKLGIALKSLDAMKLGTVGVNLGNVEAYRTALKGLSVEQSVFALASKGATEEQIRQILVTDQAKLKDVEAAMAKAGLTTATKALNAEELIALATKKGISAERAKEIASALGLIATEKGQIVSKKQLTVATLQQVGATDAEITAILGLNAAETTNIGITNVLTASFAKLWAVITAHPIGAILTAIGAVAVGTIAYINKTTKEAEEAIKEAHEEAKQALEDAKTSLSDDKSELQSVNSELETTKERLKEISSIGAPTLTEQNELTKLSTANAQLEAQQQLLENNIKLKQKAAALDAKELLGTQVEMEYSDILDNSSIVSKKESYTYAEHAEYQASKLRNAYNIYMNALKKGDIKRQQLAQELISASGGDSADFTSALLEIVESFKYDDGTIIEGYEDIYNEYMGMIYNLQSLTNPDTFLEIAKSVTSGTGIDYEKAISDAYTLAYEGNFVDISNLNQDFVKELADAGIGEKTIKYIFKLKQQEYQSVVDSINQKYNPEKVIAPTYLEAPGHVDTPEQTQQKELDRQNYEKQKEEIQAINDSLTEYTRENPIEFQLVSSYDEDFALLDKYIAEEKAKAVNGAVEIKKTIEQELKALEQGGSVNLTLRPQIDTSELNAKGWDAGKGTATVFSSTYSNEAGDIAVNFTPIIADPKTGEYLGALSPDELQEYAEGVIAGTRKDDLNLQIGTKFEGEDAIKQAENSAIKVHELHEQFFLDSKSNTDSTENYISNAIQRIYDEAKAKSDDFGNEITDSFTSIFNSEDFEESKEALLELATAGEISTDVIESSEEYRKLITETGLSAIEATERIRKMVDATTRLSDMSSDLGTLSTAYKEFKENGYASVESIEALREKFGDLKNAKGEELFENFAYVIGSSTATTEEQQKAFNNLVSAYLTSEKVFEKLTDENKDYYITQLKAMGIMNSEALITNEIAGKKKALELQDEALTITADGFNKATSEKIKALMGENAAAQSCRIALFQLTANEQIFNSNTLDTNGKVKALVELASAYGVTSEYIEKAQNAINADEANGGHTGLNFTGADVKRAMKDVYEGVYGSIADYEFNFDLGLGDIDFGLDEDSTKDSTDNIFDWIETRISRLQNAFQNMVDSVTKYVSQNFKLDSIDKQIASLDKQISTYYAGAEKYLEKANSITLSDDLRNKVINGKIEIEEISDETTREAVTEFKEWYEKYLDAIDNAAQLERDKRDKLREKLDARTWALQQQRERLSTKSDRKQDAIDFKESLEGSANTSEYQWLINNADKQYENINAENTLLKEYLSTLDSTSEEWADIQSQIESNESSMRDLISSQVEWNNKIAQMPIDKAEKAIEKLSGKEERINAKYENTNSSWAKRQLNDSLADIKTDTLKQYRNAYETTKDNFNTSAYNINQMSSKDLLVAKVQKYTKSGKEIPSDVLSSVYGSGNTLLIRRCEQYNAAYLARETAKDTYDLNKEQIKTYLADLGQKNLDTITDAYANKNTTIDNKKSLINARKENTEAKGKYADESYYNQLLTQVSRQVDAKVSERNKLKEIIDQNIKDGLWTKESQMYKDAMAQVDQLGIEIVELSTEQANYNNELNQMPIDRLQTALDILDKLSSRDSSKNDLKKALGKDLSVDDYQKEFNNIKKQEDKTLQLRNKYYQKYINAKQKGRDADADKYLQLYYEEDTALNNLKVSFEELKDEMRDDVYWRDFERAHKAAENLKTTIASIIDLYSDEMLFSDNGALTDMGVSKMGALLKEYELAKTEVVNYTNDLKNLNNLYDTGMYTEEEYKEKLAEIKNGLLDATKETKSYNDALRDMVISQKEIELEALNELIDKRKEALNAKKEYYDYDKNIKEKTKEIQSLQAQVAALEGVETAEAKAQLARAKSELQEAQDDLEETKFDHKLEVILDGFDLLQTDLQENHDAYVKNLKSSFDEQIEIISNANSLIGQSYSEVIRSITNMLQFYGVDTSSIDVGSLAGFATGGIVRAVRRNGDSALVSVNPDETILTKKFTDLLPDTVQMMSQFVNIPKMNYDFVPRRNDTPVININYDKMLNIEGNVFDMEKATMDVVKNNMKTIAKGVSNDLSTQWRKLGHK